MKVCFFCDLHLQREERSPQYGAFRWALDNMKENKTDLAVFVGDATSDGTREVFEYFLREMDRSKIRYLYIPGNSDFRAPASKDYIASLGSPLVSEIDGQCFIAVNDAEGRMTPRQKDAVTSAPEGAVVFMHHPPSYVCDAELREYLASRPDLRVFFGHVHKFFVRGGEISLQALDPDKSIGSPPELTYYDTESGELELVDYPCPMPEDLPSYFGVSSYREEEHITFAAEHGLPCLELRPSFAAMDEDRLFSLIDLWRSRGGKHLSIHLPELDYTDGEAVCAGSLEKIIRLAGKLGADRLTQHVPRVSVRTVREDGDCLRKISKALADALKPLGNVTVGVENMHMTSSEQPDESRRFGYIPEECLEFMEELGKWHRGRVGINFDVGHARNNAPFSSTYQIGAWLATVGKYAVGYHIHQVTVADKFVNHSAITDPYGHLISYASFFRMWQDGSIAKAPFVFEMSEKGAYGITLDAFLKKK